MAALTVFISHAPHDLAFRQMLTRALQASGATVWFDDPQERSVSTLPTSLELELQESRVHIVLLSPAALASAQVRNEARRYHELHAQDPHRLILPVLVEPVAYDAIWPFLQRLRPVEAPPAAHATQGHAAITLILGVLSALGLPLPAELQLAASANDATPRAYSSPVSRRLFGRHHR